MRGTSIGSIAIITAIAIYFAVTLGMTGGQSLLSPSFGLGDVWGSQLVFTLGGYFLLAPLGLIKLAAFLAALKVVAAAACAWHLVDRVRGVARGEILEGALVIVGGIALIGCAAAMWSHNNVLFREHTVPLALAAVGIALCMVERALARAAVEQAAEPAAALAEVAYSPF